MIQSKRRLLMARAFSFPVGGENPTVSILLAIVNIPSLNLSVSYAYFTANTPFSFDACAMFMKTKEHFYKDVAIYTKHFAPELQSAAAPSAEWTSIMSDIHYRLSHKEIRIFVTPYQMTLHNRKCQDILLFVFYICTILPGCFRRGIGMYLQRASKTLLVHEIVPEEIIKMKQEPGRDMVIYGSASIVQTLTNLSLIGRNQLLVFPIVLGSCKPLFQDILHKVKLSLVSTKTYLSGVVLLSYQPINE